MEKAFEDGAVTLAINDSVARVRINRETSLNALSGPVLTGLLAATKELATAVGRAPIECRAVIVETQGEKAFVAGADIKFMSAASAADFEKFITLGQTVMNEFEALPVPVIARVQGFALGGGLELALACDIIVASERAKLGLPEVKLGLMPGFGGTQRLLKRISVGAAKYMVFTGADVLAPEALSMGLVDFVVPPEKLDERVDAIVNEIKGRGPCAVAAAKRTMECYFGQGYRLGMKAELHEFMELTKTSDGKQGLLAFAEKRKPEFKGE
jgi:enoyl-CoA hydratase